MTAAARGNPNRGIAAVVAAVAVAAFLGTWSFEPVPPGLPGLGAVEFPRLVCLVLLVMAAVLAFQRAAPITEEEAPRIGGGAWLVFAACVLFLPAMELLGTFGAIPLFLVVAGRLWDRAQSWASLLLTAVGMTIALWLVFSRIFKLTLPSGWLGAALGL